MGIDRDLCLENEKELSFTFDCPVCLMILEDPLTLSCGHTLCSPCWYTIYKGLTARQIMVCPVCRHTINSNRFIRARDRQLFREWRSWAISQKYLRVNLVLRDCLKNKRFKCKYFHLGCNQQFLYQYIGLHGRECKYNSNNYGRTDGSDNNNNMHNRSNNDNNNNNISDIN